MRGFCGWIVALAGMAVAFTASADPALRNVTGLDPALLAGKTCQGVFNSGRRREGSQGALQLRFAVNGDVLTAHFWRRIGKSAYDREAYAITQPGQSSDGAGPGLAIRQDGRPMNFVRNFVFIVGAALGSSALGAIFGCTCSTLDGSTV